MQFIFFVQFNAFMALVKEMVSKVESEHRGKLEQLNSIQQEQRTLQLGADSLVGGSGMTEGSAELDSSDNKSLDSGQDTMVSEMIAV